LAVDLPFLFEDNHVLVVNKPAGLLSQADLTGDLDVLTVARHLIKRRDHKPGNVYLGLVHRLDRPVSGAMIVAKTTKAASRLSEALRQRKVHKVYLALVEGRPEPEQALLEHQVTKDARQKRSFVVEPPAGKSAKLSYRVLRTQGKRALVEVELITGLPHQIRLQLSHIGCPIVGDRKYGATEPFVAGAIALHARLVQFEHPVRREPVEVEAPLPPHLSQW
jgi:23S rRNA pseudouridine1911/1915/1917 synthase